MSSSYRSCTFRKFGWCPFPAIDPTSRSHLCSNVGPVPITVKTSLFTGSLLNRFLVRYWVGVKFGLVTWLFNLKHWVVGSRKTIIAAVQDAIYDDGIHTHPTCSTQSWILGSQIVLNLVEVGEYSLSPSCPCPYRCRRGRWSFRMRNTISVASESANEFLPLELLTCWQQQLTTDKPLTRPYKRTYLHYTVRYADTG
jgi:hypothetical protein